VWYGPALLGLAEVASAQEVGGRPTGTRSALEVYGELVNAFETLKGAPGFTRERVKRSLLDRFDERLGAGLTQEAIAYADLARSLYGEEPPAEVFLAQGVGHERRAGELEAEGEELMARGHALAAGEALYAHARAMLGELEGLEAYLESLWRAASAHESAGDLERARALFGEFREAIAVDDPEWPRATFRLGEILLAMGRAREAAREFEELVGDEAREGAAAYSDVSIVPLARAYLLDEEAENDGRAVELLRETLEGTRFEPDSSTYRTALLELANHRYMDGEHERAVELFAEAAARYPVEEEMPGVVFKLADSRRLLAADIADTLEESRLPGSERTRLRGLREEMLEEAEGEYERFLEVMRGRDRERWTEPQRAYVRNAWFYRGDCAFDLGEYTEAIGHYQAAIERYGEDPASLVAKVQIVNAYVAQRLWAQAATAQERARRHLEMLDERYPDQAWTDARFPMERRHWERWLESRALLERRALVDR